MTVAGPREVVGGQSAGDGEIRRLIVELAEVEDAIREEQALSGAPPEVAWAAMSRLGLLRAREAEIVAELHTCHPRWREGSAAQSSGRTR